MAPIHDAAVDPAKISHWIETVGSDATSNIPLLQIIQSEYGYLPRAAMDMVVENTDISASQLYGVATFYSQFRLNPVGRHLLRVCHGTACHVRGAEKLNTVVRHTLGMDGTADTTKDAGYTMEDVACVGCCSLAPVMMIDDQVFGEQTGVLVERNVKKHAKETGEKIGS